MPQWSTPRRAGPEHGPSSGGPPSRSRTTGICSRTIRILWVNRCSGKLLDAPPVSMLSSGRVRHFDEMEVDWGESFRTEGKEFAAAIAHGTQPDMDVQMAREVFAFQLAALRSDREGREVSLSEIR